MTRPPAIPADLWDAIPPNLRPAIAAVVAGLEARITHLEARIADLEARLNQTSANSSLPPSSDPPHAQPAPPRTPSGKREGGPPGHPKADRPVLPPDGVVPLKPARCRRCSRRLAGDDPAPLVHQVHEVPDVRPPVTEYRRHRLTCPGCGAVTWGGLPADAVGGYGPRTQAGCAVLAGGHRLGKRAVAHVLGDLFGRPIRPAAVCDLQAKTAAALAPAHAGALAATRARPASVGETGWTEGRSRARLWVAVTAAVTAFVVRRSRSRAAFADLAGPTPPVRTTDRYAVSDHLPGGRRPVCWAPLRRDFQAMIDRASGGSGVGRSLLTHAAIPLGQWQRVRDGAVTRRGFRQADLGWLRAEVRNLLASGAASSCPKTAATGREVLAVEASVGTFARVAGVEPTNTAAERAVVATCRRQGRGGCSGSGSRRFRRPGPGPPRRHSSPPGRERLRCSGWSVSGRSAG